jgi:hypothetical protein
VFSEDPNALHDMSGDPELLFTGEDVPRPRAEFFGFTAIPVGRYIADCEPDVYVPPEGRVILLFSKAVN